MPKPIAGRPAAVLGRVVLLAAFCITPAATADDSTWRDQLARSRAQYDAGQFEVAEKSVTAFVKSAGRLGLGESEFAEALTEVGQLFMSLGRVAEGTRQLERSLALWDRQPGVRHPGPLWTANSLVTAYIETRQLARAQEIAERTLQTRPGLLGTLPLEHATALHGLATVYHFRGKFREAESLLRKSVSVLEQHGFAEDEPMMIMLTSLAPVLVRRAQPESALACIRRARGIGEKRFGRDHVFLARVLIAESSVYRALNLTPDAQLTIERALAIVPAYMEPLVQAAWDEYARVLRQKGEKRNAESAEARAAEIRANFDSTNRHSVDIKALARDSNR